MPASILGIACSRCHTPIETSGITCVSCGSFLHSRCQEASEVCQRCGARKEFRRFGIRGFGIFEILRYTTYLAGVALVLMIVLVVGHFRSQRERIRALQDPPLSGPPCLQDLLGARIEPPVPRSLVSGPPGEPDPPPEEPAAPEPRLPRSSGRLQLWALHTRIGATDGPPSISLSSGGTTAPVRLFIEVEADHDRPATHLIVEETRLVKGSRVPSRKALPIIGSMRLLGTALEPDTLEVRLRARGGVLRVGSALGILLPASHSTAIFPGLDCSVLATGDDRVLVRSPGGQTLEIPPGYISPGPHPDLPVLTDPGMSVALALTPELLVEVEWKDRTRDLSSLREWVGLEDLPRGLRDWVFEDGLPRLLEEVPLPLVRGAFLDPATDLTILLLPRGFARVSDSRGSSRIMAHTAEFLDLFGRPCPGPRDPARYDRPAWISPSTVHPLLESLERTFDRDFFEPRVARRTLAFLARTLAPSSAATASTGPRQRPGDPLRIAWIPRRGTESRGGVPMKVTSVHPDGVQVQGEYRWSLPAIRIPRAFMPPRGRPAPGDRLFLYRVPP